MSAVDVETCRVRVKWPDKGDAESWWLEVLQRDTGAQKDFDLPAVGTLVAVLMDGKKEAGCVLGAIYTDRNKPASPSEHVRRVTFSDGIAVEYNRQSHELKVSGNVKVIVGGGASPVARADYVTQALNTLKNALSTSPTTPTDGGASYKAAIALALSGFPGDLEAQRLSTD